MKTGGMGGEINCGRYGVCPDSEVVNRSCRRAANREGSGTPARQPPGRRPIVPSALLCFADGPGELVNRPGDFVRPDDGRGRQEKVVAGSAVDAALHGINQEAALHGSGSDASGEILLGGEGGFSGFVGKKFYGPKQADAADISYCGFVAQVFEGFFELGGGGSGTTGVGGFHYI